MAEAIHLLLAAAKEKRLAGTYAISLYPIALAAVAFLLLISYQIPLMDSIMWFFGVFFCFYIPGKLLLRSCSTEESDHLLSAIHATALGMAVAPVLYGICRSLQFPPFILFIYLVTLAVWALPKVRILLGRQTGEGKSSVSVRLQTALEVCLLGILILLLLHFSYFTDLRFTPSGFLMRSTDLNETDFHLGIVNALRDTYPPMFPYASGTSYSHYHISMHLEIEMFYRIFGIDTMKLSFFYFPMLYFFLLVGTTYLAARSFFKSRLLAFITPCLIFGSDLSFIPGLMGLLPGKPWTTLFQTTIWSLFTLNGNLPAVTVLFLGVLHFKKYFESCNYGELILFSILGIALLGFKSSMGLHFAGAALASGLILSFFGSSRRNGLWLAAVSALLLAYMFLEIYVIRGGTGNTIIGLDPFNVFRGSLKRLKLKPESWYVYAAFFVMYCIASFGMRVAGFWKIKEVFSSRRDPTVIFLLVFILSGFMISEMLSITIFIGNINNAMWFSVASLTAAWVLLAYMLAELEDRPVLFRAAIVAVLLLSLPTTVQFLSKRSNPAYYEYGKEALEVINIIDRAPSGTVVLHPLNESEPSLSANFTGHQTVLSFYRSLNMMPMKEDEFLLRVRDVVQFFNPDSKIDRPKVIQRYNVTHVYAAAQFRDFLDQQPFLTPIVKNRGYVLYEVGKP